jgi:HSP20 family protein
MSMSRWDPFRPLTTLNDAVSQLMHEAVLRPGFQFGGDAPVNVWEQPDRYVIQMAIPGVKPGDVEVTCQQSTVTIKAHRETPFADQTTTNGTSTQQSGFLLAEFGGGDFTRSITLPKAFNADQLHASYDLGVLTISVPIAPEAQPKKVTITTGSPQQQIVGANSRS